MLFFPFILIVIIFFSLSRLDSDGDAVEMRMAEESFEADFDNDDFFDDGVDDDEDDFYDEDTSWKVRRTAAKVIDILIQAFPEKLADFYTDLLHLIIARISGGFFHYIY